MLLGTVLAILMLSWPVAALSQDAFAPPVADDHTLLLAHFDETLDADVAKGSPAAEVTGAELVAEGKWGGVVSLGDGQCLSFDAEGNLDMSAGTLMFWLKPDWQIPTVRSHALLSMGLDGDPSGYFVLSQGWWEGSGGAGRMYFVYDNQAYMHRSSAVLMTIGEHLKEWHHLALTWAEGEPGHNAVYLDGELMARVVKDCGQVRRPGTRLFVGSDQGTGMGDERHANALLDELVIYDRAFTEEEVADAFKAQEPRWDELQARRWAWLTDVLSGPEPVFERDDQGRILESRALLDEGCPWVNPEATPEVVDKLQRAGFNVYIPCIYHGRGTRYPCEWEAQEGTLAESLAELDVDPLAYMIEQCHASGIEVHPWFCVNYRGNDWHPDFYEEGTPERKYCCHRPEFRDFIVDLMLDVVRRYEVDGINLDYIRTGGLCKGPKCQAEYREQFGTELLEDAKLKEENGWPNARIVQWQDEAIADIVRRIAEEGRKIRSGLVISVDGHVHPPSQAPSTDGRNELPWIEAGWVDVVYNMDYGRHLSCARIDSVREAIDGPEAIVDLPGNYERAEDGKVVAREGNLVADQLAYCQRKWPGNGVGLYLYSLLSDEQIEALRAGPFKEDAIPHWAR